MADIRAIIPGHRSYGWGAAKIIALHDWISDTSSYDPVLPYLDPERCQWAFMDMRGYGLSRGLAGTYSLSEAAGDVLALADYLKWQGFHLVGHSMSGMVVQKVAALAPERIHGLTAITPVSASGQCLSEQVKAALVALARERTQGKILQEMWGDRLSHAWVQYKLRRWRETADTEASAGYVAMFTGPGFATEVAGFAKPVLAITGAQDSEGFSERRIREEFGPLYPRLAVVTLADSGHYPMQETPVLLATIIERFATETLHAAHIADADRSSRRATSAC